MNPDEIKAQMELVDGEGRDLLTEEEQSSRHNISHNSDNGYLYQDADFLCGAIIKERQQNAERGRLMKKHEWQHDGKGFICAECLCYNEHHSDCLWAKAIGKGE